MSQAGQEKIYQMITDQMIGLIEEGTVPWRQSWVGGWPKNLHSGRHYRGINTFMLSVISQAKSYPSRHWLTYKQATDSGGQVRKGEKSSLVVFWKPLPKTVTDGETGEEKEKTFFVLKYYRVFNVAQVEGTSDPDEEAEDLDHKPIEQAEAVITGMPNPPKIEDGQQPCYSPGKDRVQIPPLSKFDEAEEYYSTLFHELTHSTGHQSRLNREAVGKAHFGTQTYSKEELVAEMGAAFLCGAVKIDQAIINNSAAYVAGWLKQLRSDNKLVIKAASAAQSAADYILNV